MANLLVSYAGPLRADVDFTDARKVQFKAWQKAANQAVNAGKSKPPKPEGLRADTLYLKPGSTAMITPEELATIRADRPDVARFLQVHSNAPAEPRSTKPKPAVKAKPVASGGPVAGGSSDGEGPLKTKRTPR